MELAPKEKIENRYMFPKKVGIIFVETRTPGRKSFQNFIKKLKGAHDFDKSACAYFLLQMNRNQRTFEFQIIENEKTPQDISIMKWLDGVAAASSLSIDYWIAITAQDVPSEFRNLPFATVPMSQTKSNKRLWGITSMDWDRYFSPPSLFEYIACSVVRCTLESLSRELQNKEIKILESHDSSITKGCIFDFTKYKVLKRISVSKPMLCYECKETLESLEDVVQEKVSCFPLVSNVNSIVSREWMGNPEERDSPLYNLKKLYRYDIDRNSGFRKGWIEKIKDSVQDNTAPWVVGGLIGLVFAILLNLFTKALHI